MTRIELFSLLQVINHWNLCPYRCDVIMDLLSTTDCIGYSPSSTGIGLLLYQYFDDGSYKRYFI